MVGHGHTESLPGIDVSSRVVVTLRVFHVRAFLCRCDCGEDEESGAQRPENLRLSVGVREKVHCAAVRAPDH